MYIVILININLHYLCSLFTIINMPQSIRQRHLVLKMVAYIGQTDYNTVQYCILEDWLTYNSIR